MSQSLLRFGEFELDEPNALLTRSGAPIPLPPKAFALLCALASQPGKLADKNSLLDAIWGHRFVTESVLKTTVSQVRAALADDAAEPRFIETVSRRGYRFIGRVDLVEGERVARPDADRVSAALEPPSTLPEIVGRADALAALAAGWRRAIAGQPQLHWIAGEAGIGKTTLVDRFVAEVGRGRAASGQCIEQFGAGEPYLPIFEALKTISRRDAALVTVMRKAAPTWLAQMPWLVGDEERVLLKLDLVGAGQERVVRELFELLDAHAERQPLLLVTEDLHWADHATLRLVDHFARRRAPLRVMWLATFRLAQVIAEDHPLKALRQELKLHDLCREILLEPFSEVEVARYVEARLPGAALSEDAIRRLHLHTDGLPLFVANVLDGLFGPPASGSPPDAAAVLGRPLPVPDNLIGVIEKQLARLPAELRGMLEAASVCGMEFSARRVARLLEHDVAEVGRRLDQLVRAEQWLAETGVDDLPDGSIDARYAFRHALYRHALYQRIPAVRRATYHRFVARALAAELTPAERASHYELGREYPAAVAQYVEAAKCALERFAPREAADLTGHAAALLERCPEGDARLELELAVRAHRGIACAQLLGASAPETVAAFMRVRELCDLLPETAERALLLHGLAWGFFTRGEYARAVALAERVHALAVRERHAALEVHTSSLLGVTFAVVGEHGAACEWVERGLAVCERHGDLLAGPAFLLDPEVSMRANVGGALVMLGRADDARASLARAFARCERIRQPMARMVALWAACTIGFMTEDVDTVAQRAAELGDLVATAGLRQGLGPSLWMRGWAKVRRGDPEAGLDDILEGYTSHRSLGMHGGLPIVLGFAAEALAAAGRSDEAEQRSAESLALVARLGERGMLPLLLVIRGRIAAMRAGPAAAAEHLDAALTEARAQRAPGAELAVQMARAEWLGGDSAALSAAYERVAQGRDTPLAERARRLLRAAN